MLNQATRFVSDLSFRLRFHAALRKKLVKSQLIRMEGLAQLLLELVTKKLLSRMIQSKVIRRAFACLVGCLSFGLDAAL
ncbi:hypothetical protein V6N13_036562 [Hibiscus sabdariffa]